MSKEARIILNICVIATAIGTGLYLSRGPWVAYRHQRDLANQAQIRMQVAERDHAEALRESSHATSEAGREEIARDHGYLKDGEQRIEVPR